MRTVYECDDCGQDYETVDKAMECWESHGHNDLVERADYMYIPHYLCSGCGAEYATPEMVAECEAVCLGA